MKMQVTTTHELEFKVEAFWSEEGGMGEDQYGSSCKELAEAIKLLELARVYNDKQDWIITCYVKTSTK